MLPFPGGYEPLSPEHLRQIELDILYEKTLRNSMAIELLRAYRRQEIYIEWMREELKKSDMLRQG
jgi:hypothetical protein